MYAICMRYIYICMYVCIVHDSSLYAVGELLQSCRAVLKVCTIYIANLAAVDENIEFQVEFRTTFAAVRECRRTLIMTPPLNTGSCLSLLPPPPSAALGSPQQQSMYIPCGCRCCPDRQTEKPFLAPFFIVPVLL